MSIVHSLDIQLLTFTVEYFQVKLFFFMETLLQKVEAVETEAERIVANAKKTGQKNLEYLIAGEPQALEAAKKQAEETSRAIIKEAVRQAKQEANAMQQDQTLVVQAIHQTAQKNEEAALAEARQLFSQEYL